MKIGIDIDGVLAEFFSTYERLIVELTGKDLFGDRKYPAVMPPVWNWPQHYGYTSKEVGLAWKHIHSSPDFWLNLPPYEENFDPKLLQDIEADHDVYYITARPSITAKRQTEEWFGIYAGMDCPTVLICEGKWLACLALGLDLYIDDKGENIEYVDQKTHTQGILLDRPYNAEAVVKNRRKTLREALKDGGAI